MNRTFGGLFVCFGFCIIEKMPELLTMLSEKKKKKKVVATIGSGGGIKYRESNMELIENSELMGSSDSNFPSKRKVPALW